jgi:hypothetical protein
MAVPNTIQQRCTVHGIIFLAFNRVPMSSILEDNARTTAQVTPGLSPKFNWIGISAEPGLEQDICDR